MAAIVVVPGSRLDIDPMAYVRPLSPHINGRDGINHKVIVLFFKWCSKRFDLSEFIGYLQGYAGYGTSGNQSQLVCYPFPSQMARRVLKEKKNIDEIR